MTATVGGDLHDRVVLRGTIGPGLKTLLWFAFWIVTFHISAGWGLAPFLAFGMGANFVSSLNKMSHVAVGILAFGITLGLSILLAPDDWIRWGSALMIVFGLVALSAPFMGGARLIIDRDGVTVVDLWIARALSWKQIIIQIDADPTGKPHSITLKIDPSLSDQESRRWLGQSKDLHLADHYGLPKQDLAALLNRFRSKALGLTQ